MSRAGFRFLLLFTAFVAILVLRTADPAPFLTGANARDAQAMLWAEHSPLRVFLAIHAIVAALVGATVGWIGLWCFWRSARVLWGAGLVLLLVFYRLDLRYQPADLELLMRGLLSFFAGTCVGAVTNFTSQRRRSAKSGAVFLVGLCIVIPVCRMVTHAPVNEWFLLDLRGTGTLAYLYFGGAVLGCSYREPLRTLFGSESIVPSPPGSRRRFLYEVAGNVALVVILGAAVLLGHGRPDLLYWAGAVPVVPLIMALYAPWTWFNADSATQIFSLTGDPVGTGSSARLFLGVVFLYTVVLVAICIRQTLRRPGNLALRLAVHFFLLLNAVPGLWLLWTLARNA
ncbi:MAG: hypothetical protein KDD69_06210 [Bdellovibrionales bacterium]|nr:hypothetical protein [Bdellovibrionales bacterium]